MASRLSGAASGEGSALKAHYVTIAAPGARAARVALRVAVGAAAAVGAGGLVWFAGFDMWWAATATLAAGSLGAAIASLTFDEPTPWDPPLRATPRATRLTVAMIEQSLAACDRLARPTAGRWLRAMLTSDRDDHLARAAVMRQLRALLAAELDDRGIDPAASPGDALALLGPEALAVLQPRDGHPVTSAAIARCLDAIDRVAHSNPGNA